MQAKHGIGIFEDLEKSFQGEIRFDKETLENLSKDYSHIKILPSAGASPKNSQDISSLVKFVSTHKKSHPSLSITARSGGACVTGGPLNDSIIIDFTEHMNRLIHLEKDKAVVQPGMHYRDFDKATKGLGSYLPPYPASRDVCCVGGMVGNNSGGPQAFSHGKTEKFVKSLKVVLADGSEAHVRPLSESELQKKMRENSFEGKIYRELHSLIEENKELLERARPKVSKNSAGYSLWNVWDGETFDLTQLFTGSQGTLGIITEIEFGLAPVLPHKQLMVVFLDDSEKISAITEALAEEGPEELEMYHKSLLKIILSHYPTFVKTLEVNPLTFGFQFYKEAYELIKGGQLMPEIMVLPKFSGHSKEEARKKAEKAKAKIEKFGYPVYLTEGREDEEKYRKLRQDTFYFFQNKLGGKREVIVFDDLCVTTDRLSELIPRILEVVDRCGCEYFLAGHLGNGNLHLVPFLDPTKEETKDLIIEMTEELYRITLSLEGSISGEHNDGLTRTPYLPMMYGDRVCGLFRRTKNIFDPLNIFNPGKKVANKKSSSLRFALDQMVNP